MSAVMIKCPATGANLPTGFHAHWVDFNRMPDVVHELACPVCREIHTWRRSEAWLVNPGQTVPQRSVSVPFKQQLRLVG